MEEKEPTMQIQVKTQENHQIPTSLNQEKTRFEASKIEDHQQEEEQEQEQKRPNESKNNEQEKMVLKSDHSKLEKGIENGGILGPRERLKRHRTEVAGQVWIPDMWGQEDFLKDWIDCSAFDASLVSQNIMLARASLMEEGRRSNSNTLRVEKSC